MEYNQKSQNSEILNTLLNISKTNGLKVLPCISRLQSYTDLNNVEVFPIQEKLTSKEESVRAQMNTLICNVDLFYKSNSFLA